MSFLWFSQPIQAKLNYFGDEILFRRVATPEIYDSADIKYVICFKNLKGAYDFHQISQTLSMATE